jgi:hypothetical protein
MLCRIGVIAALLRLLSGVRQRQVRQAASLEITINS